MLRRLTLSGGDQDGATYAWMMGALLAEVAPVTARAAVTHDGAPTTARVCASLLGLALIGAASAPQQRAHLDARKPELLRVLLRLAPTDGAPLMLAIASAAGHHLELRCAPSRASELPTPVTFNSAYFLLKVLVRHGSYLLADVLGVCRERPLPPAAQRELLPGIHALLGMCTEVEVQAVHAASDPGRQRVLKDLLESYQHSFKYKGKA
ncbi:hypothetical protein Ctob_016055 [Chrysochromulina tobinii]|uniref:Nucleolar 27S pre-rRNA processing Urb2/Npa2 C-terminal domain-containing protein n=1 Tax=Chrysochromulina tobinii TaxID=1460289 RepID=A0A0M0K8M1_9EUKA|nr:hypothetical protein Ctob_016055 [Chrysochromulina tobinii]|eukprot:KOO35170.1 hypothetical protein Ctob_016055 [Chrysochromulina sp. CCMP291]